MKKSIVGLAALFLTLNGPAVFAAANPQDVQPVPSPKIQNKEAKSDFKEGVKAFKNQKYDEAVSKFEAAEKADPSIPATHINLGLALAKQGKEAEAKKHLDQAVILIVKGTGAPSTSEGSSGMTPGAGGAAPAPGSGGGPSAP